MAGEHRLQTDTKPPPRWQMFAIPVGVIAALVLGWILTATASSTQDENAVLQGDNSVLAEQRDATAKQATTLAEQVAAACAAGGKTAQELQRVGACQQAEQVKTTPVPTVPAQRGERGPAPTAEQIRSAVADYLAEHPPAGRAPNPDEVAAAVTSYMVEHPPEPGRPPTNAEIANAVGTYFDTNPPPAGPRGEPGPPPTPAEIQAAVDQHLAEHPITSVQGVGVQSVRAEQRGSGCVLVFVLHDPATDTTTEDAVPVADGVCGSGPIDVDPGGGIGG